MSPAPWSGGDGRARGLGALAVCVVLAAAWAACGGGDGDSLTGERAPAPEAETPHVLRSLEDIDARPRQLEEAASEMEAVIADKDPWFDDKDGRKMSDAAVLEMTVELAGDSGGEIHYVEVPGREGRAVLVMPLELVAGRTPLVVSLHGYGWSSADQALYIPLHERVSTDGLAVLLPNGAPDGEGNRFWNPTDHCCGQAKGGGDDVAYLTELVAAARGIGDFGPVYFFGYSNGGFMSHHIACTGLPGLRAVASLAGTSYAGESSCDGAAPVSVLQIHGTADDVIAFEGDESGPDPAGGGGPASYVGAEEMVTRWGRRAGCEWPDRPEPHATLDLDRFVPGPETRAFRIGPGCPEGISIELWVGAGSGHSPGYGDAFVDALVDWLLSQG